MQYTYPSGENTKVECAKSTFEMLLPNGKDCLQSFMSLIEGSSLMGDNNCLCAKLFSDNKLYSLHFQVVEAYHIENATIGGVETSVPYVNKYCTCYVDKPTMVSISQEDKLELLAQTYSDMETSLNKLEIVNVLSGLAQ